MPQKRKSPRPKTTGGLIAFRARSPRHEAFIRESAWRENVTLTTWIHTRIFGAENSLEK